MTESEELKRVLRRRADDVSVPSDLARTARRTAARRRGAGTAAATVALVAGVALTSVLLGGAPDHHVTPSHQPAIDAVVVCEGSPTGPSPTREELGRLGDAPVVVCRSWPEGGPAASAAVATTDQSGQLVRSLANGRDIDGMCANAAPFTHPADVLVIGTGAAQRVVTVSGDCSSYDLDGQLTSQPHGLEQLLDKVADSGRPLPEDATAVCRSAETTRQPQPFESYDLTPTGSQGTVELCARDRPGGWFSSRPYALTGAVSLSDPDRHELLTLLADGPVVHQQCPPSPAGPSPQLLDVVVATAQGVHDLDLSSVCSTYEIGTTAHSISPDLSSFLRAHLPDTTPGTSTLPSLPAGQQWVRITKVLGPDAAEDNLIIEGFGGIAATGTEPQAHVAETAATVTVYWTYRRFAGTAADVAVDYHVTLHLNQPLGDRQLLDGSYDPPRAVPTTLGGH